MKLACFGLRGNMPSEAVAKYVDVAIGTRNFLEQVTEIRRLNPNIKILLYRGVRVVNKNTPEWSEFEAKPFWLAKDVDGDRLTVGRWTNNYIVNEASGQWLEWFTNWIAEKVNTYGLDGCLLDHGFAWGRGQHHSGIVKEGTETKSFPVDQRTGEVWTDEAIRILLGTLTKKLRLKIGNDKLIIANGIYSGERFERRKDLYIDCLNRGSYNGVMAEWVWFQPSGFWSQVNWVWSVEANRFLIQKGYICLNDARTERPNVGLVTIGVPDTQLMKFAYCSALMGGSVAKTPVTAFHGDTEYENRAEFCRKLYDIDLGTPVDSYHKIEGTQCYERNFTRTKVIVNPTEVAYTIMLPKPSYTTEGEPITEVTLQPHSGEILNQVAVTQAGFNIAAFIVALVLTIALIASLGGKKR